MNKKEVFLEKAKKIHGNRYDYSLVEYISNKNKIKIICKEHGEFEQTPDKHINSKQGCPKCSVNYKLTTNDFIEKSKFIHGDKYDYSISKYKNANSNIEIICPIHGVFKQIANLHMSGSNCPICYGRNKNNDDIIKVLRFCL